MSVIITILFTVLLFGLLIFIHELGHYTAARAFGVGVREFSIGMGPKLKSWKGKVNDFSIRAFPVGGFVSMVGETSADEPMEGDEGKVGLNTKPLWQRAIVILAGPMMNLIFGFILMLIFVLCLRVLPTTVVDRFGGGSISNGYGLQEGDRIIEVDGTSVHVYNDIAYIIGLRGRNPLDIKVIRDGSEVTISGVVFPVDSSTGVSMGDVDFLPVYTKKTFGNVMYNAFWQSYSTVRMTYESLYRTIKGEYGLDAVSGPIGIGGEVENIISDSQSAYVTSMNLLSLAMLISVSLGIMNLLPIPVLDGGHLLFFIIEAIRRKPLSEKTQMTINAVFTILLFGFMIFVTFKDLFSLV